MAKRKIGLSIIVLIVAATTMVSGTYAWFLVGGFAELFDLGFDVIEAGGGIEIQGSAAKAYVAEGGEASSTGWGAYLDRDCFNEGEIIAADGKYAPVSSADGSTFTKVGLEGGYFASLTPEMGKDYNELRIKIRSTTAEAVTARINVALTGNDNGHEAVNAARISVTYAGNTTIFAVAGDSTQAVTTSEIPAATVIDSNGNSIIDSEETQGVVSLSSQSVTELTASAADANKYEGTLELANVPGNTGSEEVIVRIWIEGNDTDCTGEKLSAKHLAASISFGSASEEETPAA
ncbi:MAG: hypothetical protein IKK49_09285 [Clostridia bacterium]|nr:hypothetical protein [Clostridia bacterium]